MYILIGLIGTFGVVCYKVPYINVGFFLLLILLGKVNGITGSWGTDIVLCLVLSNQMLYYTLQEMVFYSKNRTDIKKMIKFYKMCTF
jgi:hypothetical protein